jgi:hypothetical protein
MAKEEDAIDSNQGRQGGGRKEEERCAADLGRVQQGSSGVAINGGAEKEENGLSGAFSMC